jgi:2-polyprenyl-3-methyl-5-hydroxy-6-metoxy-1,4-benzoquinol methylase
MSSRQQTPAADHVCPWWLAYTFDNPVRKLFHQPRKILGSYIEKGMKVADVGCGMGFFSIGMAEMVGDEGKVIAIDLQLKMLEITQKRATRAGLAERIFPHRCQPDKLGLAEKVDFILAFWMVHEVKNKKSFFSELHSKLAPGGKIFITEPKMHVSPKAFQKTLAIAQSTGLRLCEQPAIRFSLCALFESI